jgi:hypothetical protein
MPIRYLLPSLLALLILTRVGHFGSTFSLPDASLAVFLLGGLWLGNWGWFALLLAAAFAVDVSLARTAEEAGWCLTPAYWGLIPTYAVLWLAGRWLAREERALLPGTFILMAGLAASLAFVISNATFWAFSGLFPGMGVLEYAFKVAGYFPPYLGSAALYLALGWAVHRHLQAGRLPQPAAIGRNVA